MRTEQELMADYKQFRGKCQEMCQAAIEQDPSLRIVRGHYFCPLWSVDEPHWWTVKPDGTIYDPTARQFPSNGMGIYTEFNGFIECAECAKEVPESEATIDGRYAFCSYKCNGMFVGIF